MNHSKIVIIGAGNVGATTAFSLLVQGLCDELVLTDLNREKAVGETFDMQHSIEYLGRNIQVHAGDYHDCADASIVVITASAPMVGDDRLAWLDSSKKILQGIIGPIMAEGFQGHFIVISNPVDIMSYYVWKISGLPASQVIGTGTSLDTARLKYFIGRGLDVDPRSVHAVVMGEHGDSEMVPWSRATVGGKQFLRILADNPKRFGNLTPEGLLADTVGAAWEIIERKGNTCYGIASATAGIIRAILHDENRILPVSTLLSGEYGQRDIYAGVPTILNRTGAKEVIEVPMTEDEQDRFAASCSIIRSYCEKLF